MKLSVFRHCEETAGFRGNPIFYFHSLLLLTDVLLVLHKVATPNLTGPKPEGQGLPKPFDYKKINQRDSLGIIPQSTQNLNPNLENISKKPSSFNEWLEELKRKRRFKGW